MKRRIILSISLAVLGASFLVLAPSVEAVGVPTSAWWSRTATTTPTDELPAALPVPAPATPDTVPTGATVPEGHLLVEGAPDGATAIAAARWELTDGESSPSLTLAIGESSTVNPESVVLACKAATPWTRPEALPGTWDTKPLVDGSRCVNGVIADDLSTVTFGVQLLLSGTTLDIVFVPGKNEAAAPPAGVPQPPADVDGSTFRLVFQAPTAESVKVVPGSGFSEGEGNRFITPTTSATPDFGATDTAPPDTSAPPIDSSPAFEAPAEAASPALPPEDLAPSVPDVADAVPAAATAGPANRTIGFILLALSALVAGWAYMTSNPAAAGTAGLGRFAAPVAAGSGPLGAPGAQAPMGGLSRFARPRSTPPTRLS